MATVEEEYKKIQMSGKRPIPGQSLTNDPEKPEPYEKAPEFQFTVLLNICLESLLSQMHTLQSWKL